MRLICPNCDATYEVPDSVIPPEGRDVQCSNCGSSWFFKPGVIAEPEPEPDVAPEAEPEPLPALRNEPPREEVFEEDEPAAQDVAQTPPPAPPVPGEQPSHPTKPPLPPQAEPAAPAPPPTRAGEGASVERQRVQRRALDAQVAEVLRKEREYEARARAKEQGLEYQDDLPLEAPTEPEVAEAKVESPAPVAGSRRDLLPDIDEINSTLRATSERKSQASAGTDEVEMIQQGRKGFRTGFGVSLLILGAFAALYSCAGPISDQVPALAPSLSAYVDAVNGGRLWLQEVVGGLAARIDA